MYSFHHYADDDYGAVFMVQELSLQAVVDTSFPKNGAKRHKAVISNDELEVRPCLGVLVTSIGETAIGQKEEALPSDSNDDDPMDTKEGYKDRTDLLMMGFKRWMPENVTTVEIWVQILERTVHRMSEHAYNFRHDIHQIRTALATVETIPPIDHAVDSRATTHQAMVLRQRLSQAIIVSLYILSMRQSSNYQI
ncbi:hypothetical protein NE237_020277 [Protea cynaroides]|uniref:Uncharacterized protein n=1 Tax=Protea cynaroides TaxID=273540 RepID=A0A9Q0H5Q4_9MAGN|nr:hypothetical protein NE237_020277 [Protea cynaroides]